MRVAAIYDIHGNLPALEAVLEEIRQAGVDRVVVGGDVVPGPMPRESLAALRGLEIPVQFIQGNGERVVLGQIAGVEATEVPEPYRGVIRWVAQQYRADDEQFVASWPQTLRLDVDALGDVLFCHATPRNDSEIFTRLTPDEPLIPIFDAADAALVVCGHTHMQFDRTIGRTRVVNAGSVGMPFGEPGAYWLLLTPNVELRRTRYDLTTAAQRLRETQYPDADSFAARYVLNPPSEREMLEAFGKAELR
ncbi:MAG: metallophosphoesterase family protein [Gemmatimonadaceae bacterium]